MNRTPWLFTLLLLFAFAAPAFAITGSQVDPKAPCFRWPAVDYDGDGVFDRVDNCPNTPKGCTVDRYGCHSDTDGDGVCDGVDQCANTPAGAEVDDRGCSQSDRAGRNVPPPSTPAKQVERPAPAVTETPKPVSEVERKLVESGRIRLENVYFETGSARLLDESETTLKEVGEALEKFPGLKIEIEGHTDTRGSAAFNQRLSQSRSESVRSYLLNHFHLEADQLMARGYGESQPETKERNEEELLRNRRVELKVLNPEVLPRNVKVEQK